uniref:Protein kinase domain-containing protein n=1 Tax=Steinernema glaseri TaxID=37863 RepID=A0A1I8A2L6_9BILA
MATSAPMDNRPRLKSGQTISSKTVRYTLQRKLGDGRFGCVFEVLNERNEVFAMKVEWKCPERVDPRLGMEIVILRHIRQNTVSPHFIDYIDRSSKPGYYFIVTSLVGANLETLMYEQEDRKFTHRTALGVGLQVLEALKDLHNLGYIHRDVRPRNLCIGLRDKTHNIFLMNFGCAAIYQKAKKIRKPRESVPIRGKIMFTSLSSHKKLEQSPKDDIESLIYTIVFLCNGLPWNQENDEKSIADKKMKLREECDPFRMMHPPSMKALLSYLDKITYYEQVDHEYAKNLILQAASNEKIEGIKSEFDWEIDRETSSSSSTCSAKESGTTVDDVERIVF